MEASLVTVINQYLGIPIIPEDRRYWLVRTKGGEYYRDFFEGNYIAIGYNRSPGKPLPPGISERLTDGSTILFFSASQFQMVANSSAIIVGMS